MDRDAYYAKYLAGLELRYFLSGQIFNDRRAQGIVSIQRSRRQGHVGMSDIRRMRVLMPHVRQAHDVAKRLRHADIAHRSLEEALDWLADGVALIAAGGRIAYANDAFRAMAGRGDGFRVAKGSIEFMTPAGRDRLAAALTAVGRLAAGSIVVDLPTDFVVPRLSGAPGYLVSLRPLAGERSDALPANGAAAILFIRDPLQGSGATVRTLRQVFGLTDAEAGLAAALQAGIAVADYARSRAVSLNTAYTHLRRIKEKTGCKRLAELIRKLNDLTIPLRAE
jgi:DNA-binding CsgD family transcriptional regulator